MMKNQQRLEQFAGLVLVGAIAAGCLLVLRPYVSAILWAAILCFATWPVNELLLKWLRGRRTLAAVLMTVMLSLVLFIPFLMVSLSFADSVRVVMGWVDSRRETGLPPPPQWVGRIPLAGEWVATYWSDLAENTERALAWLKPWMTAAGAWLLRHSLDVAQGIFHLGLSLLIAFFFYRDGEGLVVHIREGTKRITGDYAQRLFHVVSSTVQSVVYGVIGTALAQGIVAGIGFALAGIPSATLLAVFTFLLSIVPVGPPIIWGGVSVWLFAHGRTGWGVFMIVYGLLAISGIDNIVRPMLISRGTKLSFALMLLGVLGGITVFGFIGIFIGPTLLAAGFSLAQEFLVRGRTAPPGQKARPDATPAA